MPEFSGRTALAFHEFTKHTHASVRRSARRLDWASRPHPFKEYSGAPTIDLPTGPKLGMPALACLQGPEIVAKVEPALEPRDYLGRLLRWGSGVSRKAARGEQEFWFRTYASAGALYPIEIYLVRGGHPDLPAGVYHFNPRDSSLVLLREGDRRRLVAESAAEDPRIAESKDLLILTGIPWRTAWKYTERGYRHLFWDAGMIVANLLALGTSSGTAGHICVGFIDSDIEELLGLDPQWEYPLLILGMGNGEELPINSGKPLERLTPEVEAPSSQSSQPIAYPAIREVHDAGKLQSAAEVQAWRSPPPPPDILHSWESVQFDQVRIPVDSVEEVIARRGSARYFAPGQIPGGVLADILDRSMTGFSTDYAPADTPLIQPYLIANDVDGLPSGSYVWTPVGFRLIKAGAFRDTAAYLCLEQRLAADAAAVIFLMIDLPKILRILGDRGYRVAQLEGGIVGGNIYLASYAHGFGATGLTFYDDDVTEFFSPDAEGLQCMLVVALGRSPRLQRRPQK